MKKWFIYLFIIIILTSNTFAYSKDAGLSWLNNNVDWVNGNIDENSFALLALKSNNYNIENGYTIMLQRKDLNNCYPAGNCNVKDTALAALALKSSNYDVKPLLSWLDSSLTRASVSDWFIQIKTEKSGNCNIIYDGTKSKKAFVNGNEKIKINNNEIDYWINIKTDLQANLNQPIEEIKVDCREVNDPSIVISLLRIVQNDFYIIQEAKSITATLTINNACYPSYIGGECNEEASFYAAFVLKKLNQDIKVTPYLVDKSDTNLDNAMIYAITNDQKYSSNLINKQSLLGYWDDQNIYTSSFAINSLKNTNYKPELGNATEWLKSKQITTDLADNGSFGNVKDTAIALSLALTEPIFTLPGPSSFCGNKILEAGEQCDDGNILNGDGCNSICLKETGESCKIDSECSIDGKCINGKCEIPAQCVQDSDCKTGEQCINQACVTPPCNSNLDCSSIEYCDQYTKKCLPKEQPKECDNDGTCDFGENEENCPNDCRREVEEKCGDSFCDFEKENEENCPLDCQLTPEEKTKTNILFWISLIIIVLMLGAGGFFIYSKFFKKQTPGKPSYLFEEPKTKPKEDYSAPRRASRKNEVDESLEQELDKSIREAEKLLKK